METTGHHIVLISPESWGKNLLSKHHYAKFLAENNTVFFLNPAVGFSILPFGNMKIEKQVVQQNLNVITYKNVLPRLNHWPRFIRQYAYKIQAKRIARFLGCKPDVVWSFDPRRFQNQQVWQTKYTLYHSVDIHPASDEQQLIQTSKMVVGLSDLICTDLRKKGADPFQTSHGCHVDVTNKEQIALPGRNTLKVVYTGNFHRHVDYNLLVQLAQENGQCDFILIGPTTPSNISTDSLNQADLARLKACSNVFMVGSVPGDDLHKYLNAADICLVLFKKEFEVVHHAPHKLMAYLASGKVILANPMSAYRHVPEDLVVQTEQAQIPQRFKEIASSLDKWNAADKMQFRKKFAADHHYRIKIHEILGKLLA
ncbi:MAG: hypothetical protein HYZ14_05830 [Bacteroidetes bacterium]|nr:hypothetical protein [Bacteroidota bacterium]